MSKREDFDFEVGFFEGLHKRMPRDIRVISMLAQLYTKVGEIDSGLEMDRKLVRLSPEDPINHYNLACSLSLKGRVSDAIQSLEKAIALGYEDFDWMRHDPDLAILHDSIGFTALLENQTER